MTMKQKRAKWPEKIDDLINYVSAEPEAALLGRFSTT